MKKQTLKQAVKAANEHQEKEYHQAIEKFFRDSKKYIKKNDYLCRRKA